MGEGTVDEALEAVCDGLDRWVGAPDAEVLEEYRRRDALAGREIRWEGSGVADGTGLVRGVDESGNLLVEPPDGERLALGSGEVHLSLP